MKKFNLPWLDGCYGLFYHFDNWLTFNPLGRHSRKAPSSFRFPERLRLSRCTKLLSTVRSVSLNSWWSGCTIISPKILSWLLYRQNNCRFSSTWPMSIPCKQAHTPQSTGCVLSSCQDHNILKDPACLIDFFAGLCQASKLLTLSLPECDIVLLTTTSTEGPRLVNWAQISLRLQSLGELW